MLPEGHNVVIPDYLATFPTAEDVTHCIYTWTVRGVVLHFRKPWPEVPREKWISTQLAARSGDRVKFAEQLRKCIAIALDLPRRIRSEQSTLIHRLLLKPYDRRNTRFAGPGRKWQKWKPWPDKPAIERAVEDPEEMRLIAELADRHLAGESYDRLFHDCWRRKVRRTNGLEWTRTVIQNAVKAELVRRSARLRMGDGHNSGASCQPPSA